MIGQSVRNPFPVFFDSNGETLENGYIYIGTTGLNSETNPINTYWDSGFLYPAAQPVRTINGMAIRSGTPATLFIKEDDYSIKVESSTNQLIYSHLSVTSASVVINDIFSEYLDPVDSIAELKLINTIPDTNPIVGGQVILLTGHSSAGDGGGGGFYWDSTSTSTDNDDTIIQATDVNIGRWKRLDTNVITVDSISSLKVAPVGGNIDVSGYYSEGDDGGGRFYWDSTSTEADNGGTIIQATGITTGRWKRRFSLNISVQQFGAAGDGITNDTASFTLAAAAHDIVQVPYSSSGYVVNDDVVNASATFIFYGNDTQLVGTASASQLNAIFTTSAIDNISNIHNSALEASHNSILPNWAIPHRLEGDIIPTSVYDHFGFIDVLPDGELIVVMRRGTTHEADAGDLVYTKTSGGIWGATTVIANDATYDLRGGAGGVMPNGRIVVTSAKRTPATADWISIVIYVSDDYGDTWILQQTITNAIPANAMLTYGRGRWLGDRYALTLYSRDGSSNFYVQLIETSDGGDTWSLGSTISSTVADYNETDILPLGAGYILAIARIGSGAGGVFVQFISDDNGVTWTEVGNIPATTGHTGSVVVTPSLNYVTNKSGKPFVILLYTDRTTNECVYRYCSVDDIIADDLTAWSYDRRTVYSAPNNSGYQNAIVLNNNRLIGNLFRETVSNSLAGAYQWEADLPDIPGYDSGWIAAAIATTYSLTHGLQHEPTKITVEFAASAGATRYINNAYAIDSAGNKGVGALVSTGTIGITIRTGSFALYVGTLFGNPTISNLTSGVMRVRAWS